MVVGTDQQEEGGGGGKERIQKKKDGAMEEGEEEEEKQRATLTEAPQPSNSGGDGSSLSLFSVPRFYFPLPAGVTSYRSVSGRPVLSGCAACSHCVLGRAASAFHPALLFFFFFHPSRVVLATFRFTARVVVHSASLPVPPRI